MGRQMKRGAAAVGLDRLQAPETLPLSDGELCSLILNILDNAIAGAKAPGVERPRLRLECHVKNDFFVFNCENSSTQAWMAGQAKKKPVETHGLGRKISGRIMARYGDLIRVETGEDFYRVTLALPLLSD